MIIAIPTKNGQVDNHFGHCEYYTLFEVDADKKTTETSKFNAPQGCGCKSGVAVTLHEMGVDVMLAGNMGNGALQVLNKNQIKVIRGCEGDVFEVAQAYLAGQLTDSGEACASHGEGHECSHNH